MRQQFNFVPHSIEEGSVSLQDGLSMQSIWQSGKLKLFAQIKLCIFKGKHNEI